MLRLPDQQRVRFPFTPVVDGERIVVGTAALVARHTPGHTDESTTYVVNGTAAFTGDTLFTTSVGRPDLHADGEGARARARALFTSLTWLRSLGPDILVLPGHTSEPVAFDGRAVVGTMGEIDAWLSRWMSSEGSFVERLVAKLPPTPPNFPRIVEANEGGEAPPGDPTDLEAGANRCAVA
jgi:glyoxylase-like metal-dependent hydrolase (beta-lactamase superfamily II)